MPHRKPSSQPRLNWKKKLLFASASTALFFLGLELFLVLMGVSTIANSRDPSAGFSKQIPLLASSTNADGQQILTTASNKESWFNIQSFPKEKPAGTKRVFCVGGSTTFGRPYSDSGSYVRWVRELLTEVQPDVKWEVINAGGVSYASYRVAAVMRELAQYDPDLFIVYSAQNEFLERRTYARMFENQSWLNDLSAILQSTRTGSVVQRVSDRIGSASPAEDADDAEASKTLPEAGPPFPEEVDEMLNHSVGPVQYERDEKWREEVISDYRINLESMISIARSADAKIAFVSPVSNLRGTSPFKSLFDENVDATALTLQLNKARDLLRSGQPTEALATTRAVVATSPNSADARYLLGQILFECEEWAEAEQAFESALNKDICSLRAIKPLRDTLRLVAAQARVPLIDAENLLRQLSIDENGHACLGDDYFLDHVHPNLRLHRVIGRWIVDGLLANEIITGKPPTAAIMESVQERVDGSIDYQETAIAFRNLAKVNHWAGKFEEAIVAARRALAITSNDLESRFLLADSLNNIGSYAAAHSEYQTLFSIDDYSRAHLPYGELLLDSGMTEKAEPYLIAALITDNEEHMARAYYDLGLLYSATDQYEIAVSSLENVIDAYPDDTATMVLLAYCLRKDGRPADAINILDRLLKLTPSDAQANYEAAETHFDLGQLQESQLYIKKAIESEPGNPTFEATLEKVEQAIPSEP
ncbi:MAG: O-GlcNAc transferase [Rhodopirellula sp.]|nr:O-GlcNAc transferase [Rhodopirellula sp.]